MPRDYRVYLEDILGAIAKIKSYLDGQDVRTALRDSRTFDAVLRNLEIVGEAAKHLPSGLKRSHPGVEWRKIGGLRDLLAHQYFGIDASIIGNIVAEKLPDLEQAVKAILATDRPNSPGAQESPATYGIRTARKRTHRGNRK